MRGILAITIGLGLFGCAHEESTFSPLRDDALKPATAPTPLVGQRAVWCVGELDRENCDRIATTVLDVAHNGCATISDGRDEQTFCQDDGPYFIPTRWDTDTFGKGIRQWKAVYGELWPMKAGTRYLFFEKGVNNRREAWQRQGELIVHGVEKITVPAGTFDTYRISVYLGRDRGYDLNYAPKLGHLVYYHRQGPAGDTDDRPRFLLALENPDGQ